MAAQLQPEAIYLGTSAHVIVEVQDAPDDRRPRVSSVEGLRITEGGTRQSSTAISGGVRHTRYTIAFNVTPERAGEFTIPQVTLTTGGQVLTQGPFTLKVTEAPVKFESISLHPPAISPGGRTILQVSYQGYRPGARPAGPDKPGVSIRSARVGRTRASEKTGMPVATFQYEVRSNQLGTHRIAGMTWAGVTANPISLVVSPFVVVDTRAERTSVGIGETILVAIAVQGLPATTDVQLVAPAGVSISPSQRRARLRAPEGARWFLFDVAARQSGPARITTVRSAQGVQVPLNTPIQLMVHEKGEILVCRGKARSEETVVGEPFVVDYEVYYRGGLAGAGIYANDSCFVNNQDLEVEAVGDLSYAGWDGKPVKDSSGRSQVAMLTGHGELNGKREQLLRFAIRVIPRVASELALDGLGVTLHLRTHEDRRSNPFGSSGFVFGSRSRRHTRLADVPPHRIIDPPADDAPAGFRGAVGTSFTFTIDLDRRKATAMSPMELTMKISGQGVWEKLAPPPLAEMPELVRDFDVSDTVDGGEVTGNTITFTQVIRPRSDAVRELPALPLVYYDYEKKAYQTAYSPRIEIEVTPGSLVGAEGMKYAPRGGEAVLAGPDRLIDDDETVLLGENFTDMGELATHEPLGVTGVLAILIAGPMTVLAVWVCQRLHRQRQPLSAVRHQRRELTAALARLTEADSFYEELANLLQSCLRLTFGLPPGEVSADRLARLFADRPVGADLQQEMTDLLRQCDTGRFASGAVDEAEKTRLVERAGRLFGRLNREVK